MESTDERFCKTLISHTRENQARIYLELLPQFAAAGDTENVEYILEEYALQRQREMHRLWLDHKSEPHAAAKIDEAVRLAFRRGHSKIVLKMLEARADEQAFESDLRTHYLSMRLIEAAQAGDLEMVKILLAYGVNVNISKEITNADGFCKAVTALKGAVEGSHLEVARVLLEAKADSNLERPLLAAVLKNNGDLVKLLLVHGASIETKYHPWDQNDDRVNSLLIHACHFGLTGVVQTLIDAGADLNARDYEGNTALTYSTLLGRQEISTALIESGADRSQTDTLLQNLGQRAELTNQLQYECKHFSYGHGEPADRRLYWETPVCADCNWKPMCDEKPRYHAP